MVLNLFLALLLNSFNCEELKSRKEVRLTTQKIPSFFKKNQKKLNPQKQCLLIEKKAKVLIIMLRKKWNDGNNANRFFSIIIACVTRL